MGNQPSAPDRERRGGYIGGSVSPLTGAEDDEGFDGLPGIPSSADADFSLQMSQPPDHLATFSMKPERGTGRSPRSGPQRRFDHDDHDEQDDEHPHNDPVVDNLEAVARNLKAEPESPEITKKKHKRKKSRAKTFEDGGDQPVTVPEITKKKKKRKKSRAITFEDGEDQPVTAQETLLEEVLAPEIPAPSQDIADEPSELPTTALDDEAPGLPIEPPRLRKKKKSKSGKNGAYLDLDNPFARSDGETVVPPNDRPSRRRKSHRGQDGRSRKLKKRKSHDDFLLRSTEPEEFDSGEDKISPSVTRQERRTRLASAISASDSLAGALHDIEPSDQSSRPGDGDAMDVDMFDHTRDHLDDINHQDEDHIMEDEPELPQLDQASRPTQLVPDEADLMSNLDDDDDALQAMASTQPQPATDDDASSSNRSSDGNREQHKDTFSSVDLNGNREARSHSTASIGPGYPEADKRTGRAKGTGAESQMALELVLNGSKDGPGADPSEAALQSEVEPDIQHDRAHTTVRPDIWDVPADQAAPDFTSPNVNTEVSQLADGTAERNSTGFTSINALSRVQLTTPGASNPGPSPVKSSPRSRTYKRQPKPAFCERNAEDDAQALAELPSNEVAATPKVKKPRSKRRLPADVPGSEAGPSSSAPKRRKRRPAESREMDQDGEDDMPVERNAAGKFMGPLTKTEIRQVEAAVEAFRSAHDMTQEQVNGMVQQNPRDPELKNSALHLQLWKLVVEACPTRSRKKLMDWCRRRFHNFVARATWTKEQDEELREMVKQHGTKWCLIGQLINRHRKDVYDRWRNYLVAGNNMKKQYWDEAEEKQFLDIVHEALYIIQAEREQNPANYRVKTNEEVVDWGVIADRMNFTRSRLQCQEKWRQMREKNRINGTALAALVESDERWRMKRARQEIRTMSHADMYHIVLAIPAVNGDAREDTDIVWDAVLESQRKKFHKYTAMLLWSRLRHLVPDQETKNVQQCAHELITMYRSDAATLTLPGDDAFDDAEEEEIMKNTAPRRLRGPAKREMEDDNGEPKIKAKEKSKSDSKSESRRKRVISEALVVDSDSEPVEEAHDDDSSRANYKETFPAPEQSSGEQSQNVPGLETNGADSQMRDGDDASVDLGNDGDTTAPVPEHDDRGGSIDLGLAVLQLDDQDAEAPHENDSPKRRKSARSKRKGKEKESSHRTEPADEAAQLGLSQPVVRTAGLTGKSKKRHSGETLAALTVQPTKAKTSRKRPRADTAATVNGTEDAEGSQRKRKKARRTSKKVPEPEQEVANGDAAISSDSDMDDMSDIPAR